MTLEHVDRLRREVAAAVDARGLPRVAHEVLELDAGTILAFARGTREPRAPTLGHLWAWAVEHATSPAVRELARRQLERPR